MRALREKRVLVGVCGGIAAYKAAYFVRALVKEGADVTVCLTEAAEKFISALTFEALTGKKCLTDRTFFESGHGILHIEVARQCDAIVIAPATANTIAKIACGIADNLLCCSVLASRSPVLLVPSMHSNMWENPATRANIARLQRERFWVVPPETGELASGDQGPGRFPETETIVEDLAYLLSGRDLQGYRFVVTAGPTREHIDPVRVLTNPASGRMGIALARAAARRAGQVCLVLGPTEIPPPKGPCANPIEVVRVETTAEMYQAVMSQIENAHALLMAAAPADQAPMKVFEHKLRKEELPSTLEMVPTVDILGSLPQEKRPLVLGFAAETKDLVESGRRKLAAKKMDLLFANPVGSDLGFGTTDNEGVLLWPEGEEIMPRMPKDELAEILLDRVLERLQGSL